ncbi:hypothetical protein ACETK8_05370 [Brevundimonas staleyi]|uniref:Autotransporter outer membrane beta-barrel domain-containing protein n=1 Tax=Brevundimonas staleyi TaxID=74326 RepID=A0ABW0FMJ2_9CAUL
MTRTALIAPLTALAVLACTAGAAEAQSRNRSPITAALNLGTTGVGAEAQMALGPVFVLRAGIDTLGYDFDQSYSDVDYAGRFDFDTVSGAVDLHPFLNGWFVSGGVYVGERTIHLNGTPNAPVEIGGQTFTPQQVGTLSGRVKLSDTAPFVGVGYDDAFYRRGTWGFRGLVGVAWSRTPEVGLNAEGGTLSNDPAFRARLEQEARDIQEDAEDKAFFPIVQLGLTARF